MEQKNSENIYEDAEVWVEIEKLDSPTSFPFKYGRVKSIDNAKGIVEVEYSNSQDTEKVKVDKVTRVCQKPDLNINDMALASSINKVDLLNNVKNRYDINMIFTNVGDTLIIVNPYQMIPDTYTLGKMDSIIEESQAKTVMGYNKNAKLNPHVFEVTMEAIYQLMTHKKYQAIVISGESGAGKTETAKHAMRFITYYFQKEYLNQMNCGVETEESLEGKILACNPVLESFGNSKTLRNDNSSRFGKYIKIFVNVVSRSIVGAYMNTYLLEKSRVCTVSKGERNYHIFYQLIQGINFIISNKFNFTQIFKLLANEMNFHLREKTKKYISEHLNKNFILSLSLSQNLAEISMKGFYYLINDVFTIENVSDARNFFETLEGLVNTGFTFDEIDNVLKIVSAILLAGNIEFLDNKGDSSVKSDLTSNGKAYLSKMCQLLSIDENILSEAFTVNVRVIKGEAIKTNLKTSECKTFRDTFTKEIYNRLFNFLVRRMNLSLYDENVRKATENEINVLHIGLLDIFGFECFQVNSFEQFCINYANEKLQQLYICDIFKETERLFMCEGLSEYFSKINFVDNSPIIDVMGGYPNGLFYLLDNECNVTQDDKNFISKIFMTHKTNIFLKKSRLAPDRFVVFHTAKDVDYSTAGFVQKNLDEFKLMMKESLNSITDQSITAILAGDELATNNQKTEKYLGGKFRVDMNNLMDELKKCVCHYIRCLKPNEEKRKCYFIPSFVMQQIKYLGILDTIRIRKEGYPIKKHLYEFYSRYEDVVDFPNKLLITEIQPDDPRLHDWCIQVCDLLCPTNTRENILFGKNLVLIRQNFFDLMDKIRAKEIAQKERCVTMITWKFRGKKYRELFLKFKRVIMLFQRRFKILKTIKKMKALRTCVKRLQKWWRKIRIRKYHILFIKRMLQVKRFIRNLQFKLKAKQAYLNVLKVKRVVRKYIRYFKRVRYLRMKQFIKGVIDSILDNYIKEKYTNRAVVIQAHVRGYLCKLRLGKIYQRIKKRRHEIKLEIACRIIQRNYRMYIQKRKVKMMRIISDKIKGHFMRLKFQVYLKKLRHKVKILQDAYRSHYYKKTILESRLHEYNQLEENLFEESNVLTLITLFPNYLYKAKHQKGSTTGTMNRLIKLQQFYEKKLLNHQPQFYFQASYLKLSPYDEPKLHFFAHILDIDTVINLDYIYEQPWAETFKEVMKYNLATNTPLQLISVGGMHTIVVNSAGKAFTWGWNGNGQCAFKSDKDRRFCYSDLNMDWKYGKSVHGNSNIVEYSFKKDGEMYADFDFEEEIRQMTQREAGMYNGNEDFKKTGFACNYYIDRPLVMDSYFIRQLSCGDDFTSIITKENKMYFFGANNYYQLGVKNKRNVYFPISLAGNLKSIGEIADVGMKSKILEAKTCGKMNVLVNEEGNLILLSHLCLDGNLYKAPQIIFVPEVKFASVECGKDFVVLISTIGLVYSFGDNRYGQLGLGDNLTRRYPECIAVFKNSGIPVIQASCGMKHVAVRTASNKIYAWGCNSHGQLGNMTLIHSNYPAAVNFTLNDIKVNFLQVSCGLRCSVFMTENRSLFWCGTCGDIYHQHTPVEFHYKKKVPELFSYENHNIIKIHHTWSNSLSIFYAVIAETASLKLKMNNPVKMKSILNSLSNQWVTKDIFPPYIEQAENFLATKHLPSSIKVEKLTKTAKVISDNKNKPKQKK